MTSSAEAQLAELLAWGPSWAPRHAQRAWDFRRVPHQSVKTRTASAQGQTGCKREAAPKPQV